MVSTGALGANSLDRSNYFLPTELTLARLSRLRVLTSFRVRNCCRVRHVDLILPDVHLQDRYPQFANRRQRFHGGQVSPVGAVLPLQIVFSLLEVAFASLGKS